jgi:hypothetical protein
VAHDKPAHHLRLVDLGVRALGADRRSPSDEARARGVTRPDVGAPLPSYNVRRCILCGAAHINATTEGRTVTVECQACDAVFEVEYDPPDSPTVRGRIEIISRRSGPPRR